MENRSALARFLLSLNHFPSKVPVLFRGGAIMGSAAIMFVLLALIVGGVIGWLIGARSAAAA